MNQIAQLPGPVTVVQPVTASQLTLKKRDLKLAGKLFHAFKDVIQFEVKVDDELIKFISFTRRDNFNSVEILKALLSHYNRVKTAKYIVQALVTLKIRGPMLSRASQKISEEGKALIDKMKKELDLKEKPSSSKDLTMQRIANCLPFQVAQINIIGKKYFPDIIAEQLEVKGYPYYLQFPTAYQLIPESNVTLIGLYKEWAIAFDTLINSNNKTESGKNWLKMSSNEKAERLLKFIELQGSNPLFDEATQNSMLTKLENFNTAVEDKKLIGQIDKVRGIEETSVDLVETNKIQEVSFNLIDYNSIEGALTTDEDVWVAIEKDFGDFGKNYEYFLGMMCAYEAMTPEMFRSDEIKILEENKEKIMDSVMYLESTLVNNERMKKKFPGKGGKIYTPNYGALISTIRGKATKIRQLKGTGVFIVPSDAPKISVKEKVKGKGECKKMLEKMAEDYDEKNDDEKHAHHYLENLAYIAGDLDLIIQKNIPISKVENQIVRSKLIASKIDKIEEKPIDLTDCFDLLTEVTEAMIPST